MKIIKVKNYRELSEKTSEIIINEVLKKPNLTIGLATGKTVKRVYKKLVKAYKNKKVNFSKIKAFALDEYYSLNENSKKSYKHYLFKKFFNKVNVKKENIHLLNGSSKNYKKECQAYEDKIKKSPIDIQLLGIGVNGHIGFNEPGSERNSKTRLVKLASETLKEKRASNRALTMGISTIMKSKKIILLASGKKKANAIFELIKGKIDKKLPASFLKNHKNFSVIIDKKAGSLL